MLRIQPVGWRKGAKRRAQHFTQQFDGHAALCTILQIGCLRRTEMTPQRAEELLNEHITMGSGYNRNAARLILVEVQKEHGQQVVDRLIVTLDLETHFGFQVGTEFKSPWG